MIPFHTISFLITMVIWIVIGKLIISHLINKGHNISRFWEWNPLWPLGLFEWLDDDKFEKEEKQK